MWVHTVNMWVGPRGIILENMVVQPVINCRIDFRDYFCTDTMMCGNRGWLHLLPVVVFVVPRLLQACIINKAKCQGDNARLQLHLWRPVMMPQRENKMLGCRRRHSDKQAPTTLFQLQGKWWRAGHLRCDCKWVSTLSVDFISAFTVMTSSVSWRHPRNVSFLKTACPLSASCFSPSVQTGWCNHHQKTQDISILS